LRISIFGLGYVGTVSAGCLAQQGHEVTSVDPIGAKVDLINAGQTPIIEAEIGEIIAAAVKSGRLRATGDTTRAICETELSFATSTSPISGASANRSARP